MKGYLDAKELESYKKEDLQELAKQLGVDAEGTKKEIAARCAAVEVDIPDKAICLAGGLISAAFIRRLWRQVQTSIL